METQTLSKPFLSHSQEVVQAVRAAFGAIAAALPGSPIRGNELQRALGIDKNLAWKFATLIGEEDSFAAAKQLPGPGGIDIFLEAVRKRDVPPALIEQARHAVREFEELIRVHAGDRASLEMMMSGFATRDRHKIQLSHRKTAFQGQRYIWGVEAKTHLSASFVSVAEHDSSRLTFANVRGFIGFRRIRPNVSWVITRPRQADNDGKVRELYARVPLDPALGPQDVPLFRAFCSERLPELRKVILPNSSEYEVEVVEGPVGDTAAMTLITAEMTQDGGSRYRDEHNKLGRSGVHVLTPTETLVVDVIVHEDAFGRIKPDLGAYSALGFGAPFPLGRRAPLHPSSEAVEYLGKGSMVMQTPDVPNYQSMAQAVFKRMGWDEERFDVFRVRVPYPVVPASYVLTHELQDKPR